MTLMSEVTQLRFMGPLNTLQSEISKNKPVAEQVGFIICYSKAGDVNYENNRASQ